MPNFDVKSTLIRAFVIFPPICVHAAYAEVCMSGQECARVRGCAECSGVRTHVGGSARENRQQNDKNPKDLTGENDKTRLDQI